MSELDCSNVRLSEAWKQRINAEDKALLRGMQRRGLLKPSLLRTSGGANILPHLLSLDYINQLNLEEQQKSSRSVTTGRTESEAQSIPSSRSTSSKISSVSTKSFKSTSTTARLLSEADMKIKELEKTLKQEQQGRLEVQKEVERLRSLMEDFLKSK